MGKNNVFYIAAQSGVLSVYVNRDNKTKHYLLDETHPSHQKVVGLLKAASLEKDRDKNSDFWTDENVSVLETACDLPRVVEKAIEEVAAKSPEAAKTLSLAGTAEIRNGQVYVNNVPVHNVITDRIMDLVAKGHGVVPVLRFLENLLENPSSRAQEELYDFLANRALPLTEDGHFLAYKRVSLDWLDIYSGTIDNSIGKIVEVPREAVDANRGNTCSSGLHVGALEYVRGYGSGGHVVIVKVNPRDCISVPLDHKAQKLRTCRYEVLYEHDEALFLDKPVYTTDGAVVNLDDWAEENAPSEEEGLKYWETGWNDGDSDDVEYCDFCGENHVSDPCDDEQEEVEEDEEDWNETSPSYSKEEDEEFEAALESYLGLTQDELAYNCQNLGIVATRQEGRDKGKGWMAIRLASKECGRD